MNKPPFIVTSYNFKSLDESTDPDNYLVEGYASIYGNIDSYRDIVEQGAFAQDLLKNGKERPILWQHNSSKPLGLGTFEDRPEGLYVTIKMPKASDFVSKEVMPMIRIGAVKGLSIGYFTEIEEWDSINKVNRLKQCKLRETSAVTFPANDMAQITAAKQFIENSESSEKAVAFTMHPMADEKTVWSKPKAVASIREHTNSTDEPSSSYKKGFMYYDPEKSDSFGGYKLPYVEWIDGGFKIVPKAIYAISGALSGARGGLNIPEEDKSKIKAHINKIYKKLGREEPFKKNNQFYMDSCTIKYIEKSDMDIVFDEKTILSNGAKKYILSVLCYKSGSEQVNNINEENELLNLLKSANKSMEEINGRTD